MLASGMQKSWFLAPVAVALLAPLGANALELSNLHLPMSRTEADNSLSKDYDFRLLEDVSVRRSWKITGRTVDVDFSLSREKAVLITVTYDKPVSVKRAEKDAQTLAGESLKEWKRTKASKIAEFGMKRAEFTKTSRKGYIFRELNSSGKCTRLSYFDSRPSGNRFDLGDLRQGGEVTAMGNRAGASSDTLRVLRADEEKRRATPPKAIASTTSSKPAAKTESKPAEPARPASPPAVAVAKPAPAPAEAAPDDDEEEFAFDAEAMAKSVLERLEPLHYGIAGGVVALLLLWWALARHRAAKRKAAAVDAIMKGKPKPKKPEDPKEDKDKS